MSRNISKHWLFYSQQFKGRKLLVFNSTIYSMQNNHGKIETYKLNVHHGAPQQPWITKQPNIYTFKEHNIWDFCNLRLAVTLFNCYYFPLTHLLTGWSQDFFYRTSIAGKSYKINYNFQTFLYYFFLSAVLLGYHM